MLVSVVVPLYNKRPEIERCLATICAQTYPNMEVIVVNDGSTDGGDQLVRNWTDHRVRLIDQANAGPGAARNRGLREARGELIAFLDADDEWQRDYLENAVRALQDDPELGAVTFGYLEYPSGENTEPMWKRRGLVSGNYRVTTATHPRLMNFLAAFMSPCSTVARTGMIRELGGFFDRDRCLFGEDQFLWIKVLLRAKVRVDLRPLTSFHRESSGLSANLAGARPVEPMFTYAAELRASCPHELLPVLAGFLAYRSHKTACMLGYWGKWREAADLRRRFRATGAWKDPYYLPALVCGTPVGASLGTLVRAVTRRR